MLDEAQIFALMSLNSFGAFAGPGSEACNWHIRQGAINLGLSHGLKGYPRRSDDHSKSHPCQLSKAQAKKVLASTRYYGTSQARIYSFLSQNHSMRLLGFSSVTVGRD